MPKNFIYNSIKSENVRVCMTAFYDFGITTYNVNLNDFHLPL